MNGTAGKWKERGAILGGVVVALALMVVSTIGLEQARIGSAQAIGPLVSAATPSGTAGRGVTQQQPFVTRTPFQPQRTTATATPMPTATATLPPPPPPAPPPEPEVEQPEPLPDQAEVQGVSGYFQSLPLSCEARSAADWASFFGASIGELEFQERLPRSDNPERGFVGSPRDWAGMIPPNSYGVHAGPVAELLRAYGVPAEAKRWMSYENLQREIAAGRPVIVWVVSSVIPAQGVEYTASDGESTLVAALEHTVMIVGYNESAVQVVDGGWTYSAGLERFMNSWGALGNQAVVYGGE